MDSLITWRKQQENMKRIKRENVAAKYGPCVECGIGTRSHVLEAAEWEEYEEEVVVARSDDFASTAWEEVDTITKFDLVKENKVMCHKCWCIKQDKFAERIKAKYELWMDKTVLHAAEIKKAVNTQIAYDFEDDKTILALKNLAKQLKEAALDG